MPSGFLDVVRIEAKDDLCSGNKWYLIASKSNSLHSVFSLTKPSVSTWVIKNSRLINGSLTCFISCKKNSDILRFFSVSGESSEIFFYSVFMFSSIKANTDVPPTVSSKCFGRT